MMHERAGGEGVQLKPRRGTGATAKIENKRKHSSGIIYF